MALNFFKFLKTKPISKFLDTSWCDRLYINLNLVRQIQTRADPTDLGKIVDLQLNNDVGDERKLNIKFQKIDGKSSLLTNYLVNVKSRKKREKSKTILLEGKRLIQDALDAKMKPLAIFFSRVNDVTDFKLDEKTSLYNVPYKDLQFWSDVTTSQGVLAIFPLPDTQSHSGVDKIGLTIVCDNVRDPGNMGNILRTAAAVGSSQVLLTTGCADLWEPKILRSASGAHFRLKIHASVSLEELPNLIPKKSGLYLADSNVPELVKTEYAINRYEISETGEKIAIAEDQVKRVTAYQKKEIQTKMPLMIYTEPDYSIHKDIVLVIGGETEGLSENMIKLADEIKGTRIYIPLENGVESLNSATATSILAYEIRKQRLGL